MDNCRVEIIEAPAPVLNEPEPMEETANNSDVEYVDFCQEYVLNIDLDNERLSDDEVQKLLSSLSGDSSDDRSSSSEDAANDAAETSDAANEEAETADAIQAADRANHRELNGRDADRLRHGGQRNVNDPENAVSRTTAKVPLVKRSGRYEPLLDANGNVDAKAAENNFVVREISKKGEGTIVEKAPSFNPQNALALAYQSQLKKYWDDLCGFLKKNAGNFKKLEPYFVSDKCCRNNSFLKALGSVIGPRCFEILDECYINKWKGTELKEKLKSYLNERYPDDSTLIQPSRDDRTRKEDVHGKFGDNADDNATAAGTADASQGWHHVSQAHGELSKEGSTKVDATVSWRRKLRRASVKVRVVARFRLAPGERIPDRLEDIPPWIKKRSDRQEISEIQQSSLQKIDALEDSEKMGHLWNCGREIGESDLSEHPCKDLIVDSLGNLRLLKARVSLSSQTDDTDEDESKHIGRIIQDLNFLKNFILQFEEVYIKTRGELKRQHLIFKETRKWQTLSERGEKRNLKETAEDGASKKLKVTELPSRIIP
ncbi:hypothetical protein AURANDRAFT_67680 [Aureococcus anophagefferens]|uniref:Uncharacterized protein n=1 Tax=Aureococcus anophagefferens TaxID=44056 RepID=F0YM16_AURAN|nr:hypothetical protein AURANDRAFT_67680 [Aureococcus anophagefferens]EGB03844.1 hypothetical protein AURANDRAFT_67680 [Aureococcus anophagefferens]|eukprot:XP_009041502.1 hypothetical protein AURANDRAFT_67680 [Aureococcus anophagefferens]